MKKLSLRQQIWISVFSFTIPIAILSILMFQAQTVNIQFGAQEREGLRYQAPLQKILEAVSWHRIYSTRIQQGSVQL